MAGIGELKNAFDTRQCSEAGCPADEEARTFYAAVAMALHHAAFDLPRDNSDISSH